MKVLVPGAAGMLGRAIMEQLGHAHDMVGLNRSDLDIRDSKALESVLDRESPDALVNCAGYTRVDDAEDEPDVVMEINAGAPARMAATCCERNIIFVHISSDYVFDGLKGSPYKEDDPAHPLNVYGRSKLDSERRVAEACPAGLLILRTSWLFGHGGRSFVSSLLERYSRGGREFRVVSDQVGRPTYAPDLALVIRAALEKGVRGIYHACNQGATSWFEFAKDIFKTAGLSSRVRVRAVTSEEFETRAARPSYSVLDTDRLESCLGFHMPDYKDALARYIETTYACGFPPLSEEVEDA